MPDGVDIATLGLKVDGTGAIQTVDTFGQSAKKAAQAGGELERSAQQVSASMEAVEKSARRAATASELAAQKARINAQAEAEWAAKQRARAAQQQAAAAEGGRAQAAAMVEALERQFQSDMARVKEGQARGFITPAEARAAGREAAVAYNQGLVGIIDVASRSNAFSGREGQAAYAQVAGSLKNVTAESRRAGIGLSSVRSAMTSVTAAALQTAPGVGQLVSVVGSMAIGTGLMIGVMAGIAALALGWDKLTEKSRATKKATQEALDALKEIEKRRQGPEGEIPGQVAVGQAQQRAFVKERNDLASWLTLRGRMMEGADLLSVAIASRGAEKRLAVLHKEIADAASATQAGLDELKEIRARNQTEINAAAEEAALSGLQGSAQAKARIEMEASNRARQATLELTGEARDATLKAIETEKQYQLIALSTKDAIEAENQAIKQRAANGDMVRQAEQAANLAGMEGIAQERLRIAYDATNKSIEARRTLTGKLLQETLAAIEAERRLAEARIINGALVNAPGADVTRFPFANKPPNLTQIGIGPAGNAEAADLVRKAQEASLKHFNETLEAVRHVTSSFGDLADALGKVDPAVASALRGVASFTNGLSTFREGRAQGGLLGTLSQVSGIVGMAAGAVQLIGGFLNRDDALNKERNDILRKNQDALVGMRDDLRNVMNGTNLGHAGGLASSLAEILRPGGSGINALGPVQVGDAVSGSFFTDPQLAKLAADAKLSFAQLNEIARQSGITLLDSTGHAIPQAFDQLVQAIDLTVKQITTFGKNLEDVQKRQSAYNKLFDVANSPSQQLGDSFSILQKMAPELLRREGLTNLNLDSATGRSALLSGLQNIFRMIDSGQLTPELLGAFTDKNQLLDAILATKDGLDAFRGALVQAATDVPKAINLALYEQMYATVPGQGGGTGSSLFDPTPRDTGPSVPSGGAALKSVVVQGPLIGAIVNEANDTPETLGRKMEEAANYAVDRGGYLLLRGVRIEG